MRLHVVPGEGHYSLAIRHAATILRRLTEPPHIAKRQA